MNSIHCDGSIILTKLEESKLESTCDVIVSTPKAELVSFIQHRRLPWLHCEMLIESHCT